MCVRLQIFLEFLFFQTMLEEIQEWHTIAIDVTIFDHSESAFAVHGLSSEDLQVLELTKKFLADLVYVGFEDLDLVGVIFFQLSNDSAKEKNIFSCWVTTGM